MTKLKPGDKVVFPGIVEKEISDYTVNEPVIEGLIGVERVVVKVRPRDVRQDPTPILEEFMKGAAWRIAGPDDFDLATAESIPLARLCSCHYCQTLPHTDNCPVTKAKAWLEEQK